MCPERGGTGGARPQRYQTSSPPLASTFGVTTVIDRIGFLVRFWELKARHATMGQPLSPPEQVELLSLMQLVTGDYHVPEPGPCARPSDALPAQLIGEGILLSVEVRYVCAGALLVASVKALSSGERALVRMSDAITGVEYTLPCHVAWAYHGNALHHGPLRRRRSYADRDRPAHWTARDARCSRWASRRAWRVDRRSRPLERSLGRPCLYPRPSLWHSPRLRMALEIQVRYRASHRAHGRPSCGRRLQARTTGQGQEALGLLAALRPLDAALGGALAKLAQKEEFTGKRDQTTAVATLGRMGADKLVVYGLGEKRSVGAPASFERSRRRRPAQRDVGESALPGALVAGRAPRASSARSPRASSSGAYRFTKYLTGDRKPKSPLRQRRPRSCAGQGQARARRRAVALGQSVAAAVNLARDLSNEPGNVIYPESFAAAAERVAKDSGLKIQVFDFKEIRRRGMKLIDAVGRGQRSRAALRPPLLDAEGREAEARLRRQGHHLRQRRPQHQARAPAWAR